MFALALAQAPAAQAQPATETAPAAVEMGAAELFHYAENAAAAGDRATAIAAYRALAGDPHIELRNEARFRLAQMLAEEPGKAGEAAILLRAILAEQPGAARVRLELARIEAAMGDRGAAARDLRLAASGGLPPQVERMVRFFSNALSTAKRAGGSLEATAVGDSNINRATQANTLATVIGDFVLSDDARARAGLGLSLQGQAYWRGGIDRTGEVLASASLSADLFARQSAFNDIAFSLRAGPVLRPGHDRLALTAGPVLRWYGGAPYSRALTVSADWQHVLGARAQLRLVATVALLTNRRNPLQDAINSSGQIMLDREFGRRSGGGLQISASRTLARDPGYSDVTAGASGYAWHEFGRLSSVLSVGWSHLEADTRLFLYPKRRTDDRLTVTGSLTWRRSPLARFAPFARVRAERNVSTVGLYAYRRFAGELGISAAF
ncbi:hypothetical protein AQZ52_13735 [Novosphingobium fuchskuhlense]|uniref:DUF560 domain-containing protein n=1 Tax=Novosphingobium fuchskuhlense TaxID=1117702 RepID=A0A124JU83_9SPHN|nr:hypothetical protein AQZ52_13735 [Novosphingobium fuchskuhlense]